VIAEFVHEGSAIDFVPATDVGAGEVVVIGDLVGVTKRACGAGELGSLAVEGVSDFPKATGAGSAIPAGSKLYWDVADKQAKTDSEAGANKYLGKSTQAASDADATVRARLSQ
jgi:predicted RecA/RadA family phage recombinase